MSCRHAELMQTDNTFICRSCGKNWSRDRNSRVYVSYERPYGELQLTRDGELRGEFQSWRHIANAGGLWRDVLADMPERIAEFGRGSHQQEMKFNPVEKARLLSSDVREKFRNALNLYRKHFPTMYKKYVSGFTVKFLSEKDWVAMFSSSPVALQRWGIYVTESEKEIGIRSSWAKEWETYRFFMVLAHEFKHAYDHQHGKYNKPKSWTDDYYASYGKYKSDPSELSAKKFETAAFKRFTRLPGTEQMNPSHRPGDIVDIMDDNNDWVFGGRVVSKLPGDRYLLISGVVVREVDTRPHQVEFFGRRLEVNPGHGSQAAIKFQQDHVPAVKLDDGTIILGKKHDIHGNIISRLLKDKSPYVAETGFYNTKRKEWVSRHMADLLCGNRECVIIEAASRGIDSKGLTEFDEPWQKIYREMCKDNPNELFFFDSELDFLVKFGQVIPRIPGTMFETDHGIYRLVTYDEDKVGWYVDCVRAKQGSSPDVKKNPLPVEDIYVQLTKIARDILESVASNHSENDRKVQLGRFWAIFHILKKSEQTEWVLRHTDCYYLFASTINTNKWTDSQLQAAGESLYYPSEGQPS